MEGGDRGNGRQTGDVRRLGEVPNPLIRCADGECQNQSKPEPAQSAERYHQPAQRSAGTGRRSCRRDEALAGRRRGAVFGSCEVGVGDGIGDRRRLCRRRGSCPDDKDVSLLGAPHFDTPCQAFERCDAWLDRSPVAGEQSLDPRQQTGRRRRIHEFGVIAQGESFNDAAQYGLRPNDTQRTGDQIGTGVVFSRRRLFSIRLCPVLAEAQFGAGCKSGHCKRQKKVGQRQPSERCQCHDSQSS